jgi:predicted flap endonuclease-1-like 5' DNA nuclease
MSFQEGDAPLIPWWVWLTVILVGLLLFLILAVAAQRPGPPLPKQANDHHAPPAPVVAGGTNNPHADDLRRIVGIGSHEAAVLAQAGVTTYAQLVDADPLWLTEVLDAAGLRRVRPDAWMIQAKLAADGRWREFDLLAERLQDERN